MVCSFLFKFPNILPFYFLLINFSIQLVNILPKPCYRSNNKDTHGRDVHGESETLRMLSQTHLHSPAFNEMQQRYGPYRSPGGESQMLQNFAHIHPPNFHVGTSSINFTLAHTLNRHKKI